MPYTSNPYAPKARMMARNDVVWGRVSMIEAAHKYGVARSTIWKWVKKAEKLKLNGNTYLWTDSSAPKRHSNQLSEEIENRIVLLRKKLKRCAPIIHAHLKAEGIQVSLSSVERTLRRHKLTRKKKQTNPYVPLPRPVPSFPGVLVQLDTIHLFRSNGRRSYVYALIDLYSRMAYAEYHETISHRASYQVVLNAQKYFGFPFRMVQTDHGAEFSEGFSQLLKRENILLRHSRVRKPNDNAHIERFNRTIQEECLHGLTLKEEVIQKHLKKYLVFYNTKRLHLALNCQTPTHFVSKLLT